MISQRSLLISILISLFIISSSSLGVLCARLKHVSGGEYHTLALMDDNTLWACGDNSSYQLGLGSAVGHAYTLKQVLGEDGAGFLQNVITYDAGWYHSLAADANGICYAWGQDDYGQLGNGTGEEDWDVPEKVNGHGSIGVDTDIIYVSAGRSGEHSLAVDSNGYVHAWGRNDYGQCGNGTSGSNVEVPVLVHGENNIGYLQNIIAVDAGKHHSLALDDEGHVWQWGQGSGTETYPEKVKASSTFGGQVLSDIVQISSCGHSLAVDSNGTVWEWNNDSDDAYKVQGGEMGTTYLEDINEVGAGNGYSMARTNDGHVLVWSTGGSPAYVERGEMETESGLLEGIISIGAGYSHKTAICENGYGWAWGSNGSGRLGVGDTTDRDEPTQMLCAEASSSIYLTKTSEIQGSEPNCARPFIGMGIEDNYLVYDINFGNPITNPSDPNYHGSIYDVNIIDHLPLEVDEPYYISDGGSYDSNNHTVKWTIGELAPGDTYSYTITTKVNDFARPGGEISNFVEMTADMYYYYTTDTVPVCNWGGEIIYVDEDATGYNNGTSWDDAYTDLTDAFTGAQSIGAEITAIWVAAGTYKPVESTIVEGYTNYSFEMLEGLGLFGHFGGVGTYETSTSQRDFSDPNNETILEGQIGTSESEAVIYIIKAEDIEDGVVDGFTIRGSDGTDAAGIHLDNSDISIVNCKLKENDDYGIYAENYSFTDIHNCLFLENSSQNIKADTGSWPIVSYCTFDGNDTTTQGIETSSGTVLNVENSIFKDHTGDGIKVGNGELEITNCSMNSNSYGIQASGSDLTVDSTLIADSTNSGLHTSSYCSLSLEDSIIRHSGGHGVKLENNTETTILNSWIHNNGSSGLYSSNHTVNTLLVRNNTIYDNGTYGIECSEYGADPNIVNCIITGNDSNDLYRVNGSFSKVNYCLLQNTHSGSGNITGDPGFMNISIDSDDLHLDGTSQCKDVGDPNGDYDETDIDGESRIKYGRVDIGADEYYWSPADIDEDGYVNFIDYATVAAAWMTDSGDGNYDEDCDLEDDNSIDISDLALFCEDWLWQAAWPDKQMLLSTGFDSGIPGTWTVDDGYSDDETWMTNNPQNWSSEYFNGAFCLVDSDYAGSVDMNEQLITPSIDCSETVEVILEFSHYFYVCSGDEKCDVDISIDNGAWQNILQYTDSSTGGYISEDISAYAAGQSNVRIRWHYYDANYDWYWGIDDVKVIGNYRASTMQMSMGGGGGSMLKSMGFGLESLSLMESSLSASSIGKAVSVGKDTDLMLSVFQSQKARPERLRAKSQKFYDITPETTISAKQKQLDAMKIDPASIKEILEWLDEIWLNGDLKESMTEEDYLEFRKAIEESGF